MSVEIEISNIRKLLAKIGLNGETKYVEETLELLSKKAPVDRIRHIRREIEKTFKRGKFYKHGVSLDLQKFVFLKMDEINMEFSRVGNDVLEQIKRDYSPGQNFGVDMQFPKEKEVEKQFSKNRSSEFGSNNIRTRNKSGEIGRQIMSINRHNLIT